MAAILMQIPNRSGLARPVLVLTTLVVLVAVSVPADWEISRLPREAHAEAAAVIRNAGLEASPAFAFMLQPRDLRFYLERPVSAFRRPEAVGIVCERREQVALVVDPWRVGQIDLPCGERPGVRRERLEQYARGGHIDVWLIPPAS
jgi:hypothetical protein